MYTENNELLVNEIAKNLTPEYWPHIAILTDARHHLIYPTHFYNNFKCLFNIYEDYISDDNLILLSRIDVNLLRYTLWVNNSETYKDDILSQKNESVRKATEKIQDQIYAFIAPQCFKTLHHFNGDSNITDQELDIETKEILTVADNVITEMFEEHILPKNFKENISLNSNMIYKILMKQWNNE